MKMRERFPDYLKHTWRTWRDFKREKRREARAIDKALDDYRLACAFAPGYPALIERIEKDVKELRRLLSEKEWGR